MKKKIFILALIFIFTLVAAEVFALTVTARSVSSGTYEDGKFNAGGSGFEARYIIDEIGKTIRVEKVIQNNREGKVDEDALYEITNISVSEGMSAMLVSRDKKGQHIVTAVREASPGTSETLIIGKDFYEYCCAANGKFYLESGEIISSE